MCAKQKKKSLKYKGYIMSDLLVKEYHVLFHDGSQDILLATNPVKEKVEKFKFSREENNLLWTVNDKYVYMFNDLEEPFWDKVLAKNALLVEFSPVGPISQYEIVL